MSTPLRRGSLLACLVFTSILPAQPAWWGARGVTTGQSADDYAVANIGQLKTFATAAAFEINSVRALSGGAGEDIDDLLLSWWQPPALGIVRDDYVAINQGQLKTVAELFYTRLGLALPWTATTSDDDAYALANLGQLKNVFTFSISAGADGDTDGLLDSWENTFFGGTSAHAGSGNADGDTLSNRAENLAGTNPNSGGTAVSAATLGLMIYSP